MVTWVDRENRELGVVPRSRMRREKLAHRASFVYVFRSTGKLLVQRRTLIKDVWPGYLDLAAGGVVARGETYLETARRELSEEMGISGVELREHFDFWIEEPDAKAWGRAYSCVWDGPVVLQVEEVAEVLEVEVPEALAGRLGGAVTPDSLEGLRRLTSEFFTQP